MDSQSENKLRIVVADDHPKVIKTVSELLGTEFELVGSAKNGLEAIGAVAQFKPDVLITDIEMPMMDGIRAARHLRRIGCNVNIVFISSSPDPEVASAAMSDHGSGFVLKSRMATDLVQAVREVIVGGQFVSETVHAALAAYQTSLAAGTAGLTLERNCGSAICDAL